jgi:hypothetical protein
VCSAVKAFLRVLPEPLVAEALLTGLPASDGEQIWLLFWVQ